MLFICITNLRSHHEKSIFVVIRRKISAISLNSSFIELNLDAVPNANDEEYAAQSDISLDYVGPTLLRIEKKLGKLQIFCNLLLSLV